MAVGRSQRSALWWSLFIIILMVIGVLFLYPKMQAWKKKAHELKQKKSEEAAKKDEIEKRRNRNEGLRNSPDTVESVAREKYNMRRPGETVMRYQEKKQEEKQEK